MTRLRSRERPALGHQVQRAAFDLDAWRKGFFNVEEPRAITRFYHIILYYMYTHICICICICMCIYIYIISLSLYIYIYIYIYAAAPQAPRRALMSGVVRRIRGCRWFDSSDQNP